MTNSISDLFSLKEKNIILTGSAGFLGSQYSKILSEAGANVILVDINNKKNKKLYQELQKQYDTKLSAFRTDITKESEIKKLRRDILKKYKKIDVLVNNAVFHPKTKTKNIVKPFESFPLDLWNHAIAANLTGIFLCCREFGEVMKNQRSGVIVNVSSIYVIKGSDPRIYGKSGLNLPVSYAVTKAALVNLTRYLASYWHGKNVRVNTLTLGGVYDENYMDKSFVKKYSNKTILGRMAKREEFNGALLFLLSQSSSYMTGSNLIIDGGWTAW